MNRLWRLDDIYDDVTSLLAAIERRDEELDKTIDGAREDVMRAIAHLRDDPNRGGIDDALEILDRVVNDLPDRRP